MYKKTVSKRKVLNDIRALSLLFFKRSPVFFPNFSGNPSFPMGNILTAIMVTLFILALSASSAIASSSVPGNLYSYSTMHSIGIDWDITGDTNHNAQGIVQYRKQGQSAWKRALDLERVDFNGYNMLAGSIFFLEPGTTYEVKLDLSDADGGADSRTITVTTRAIPALPTGGSTYHVIPASGGGTGTASDPFKGLASAYAVAKAGDIFLLHSGTYPTISFDKAGAAGSYIVWKAAGDEEVILNGPTGIGAHYNWFEGIHFVGDGEWNVVGKNGASNVIFIKNKATNCIDCVLLDDGNSHAGAKDWYVADNVIIGDVSVNDPTYPGEGIELTHGTNDVTGHVIAYNSISGVGDAISVSSGGSTACGSKDSNIDIYGNDIFDIRDDGLELDGGCANIRVWGNRIHNAVDHAISFQPQNNAPWYIIRNQLVNNKVNLFKFQSTNGHHYVALHNLLVGWKRVLADYVGGFFSSFSRNNLWVSANADNIYGIMEVYQGKNWLTDMDYDGFDWAGSPVAFQYNIAAYSNIASFSSATGIEQNGLAINKSNCFENFNFPAMSPASTPAQYMSLKTGCNAIDYGSILPNINDGLSEAPSEFSIYQYNGSKPDLGVYETGRNLPQFGPRNISSYQCSDGQDNDGDGMIDYPSDPGCSYSTDNNEYNDTPPAPDTQAPSVPSGLTATVASATQINLGWNASTDNVGVAGYKIYRNGSQVGTSTTTSYSDTGLTPSTTYTYKVEAYDAAGNTALSASVSATTPAAPDTQAPSVSIASPASGSTVSGTINVSASASDNVEVAGVQFKLDGSNLGSEDTSSPYSVSWDTTTATNDSHTLTATARDAAGNTTTSSAVTITVNNDSSDTQSPTVPTGLTATAASATQINLSWNASTDNVGVVGYRIYRNGVLVATSTSTTYADVNLSPSTTYNYTVKAYDTANNESSESSPASATTQSLQIDQIAPSPPTNLHIIQN